MTVKNPPNEDIQALLGLYQSGQLDKALASARRLAAKFPQSPVVHLLQGVVLASQDKLDPAIHSYRKALALNPTYVDALNNLGVALRKGGRLSEAMECYERALGLQPGNADISQNLQTLIREQGVRLFEQGRFAEAAAFYRRDADMQPSALALTNLGLALFHGGAPDEAYAALENALRLEPDRIQTLAHAAVIAKALNKPFAHFLRKILGTPADDFTGTTTQMWAAFTAGDPKLAFSYRPAGINVLSWDELGQFYRSPKLKGWLDALPKLGGTLPHQNTKPLLYAGGDGVYAARFARDLIASALEKCPDADFHIHLMNLGSFNPDEAFAAFPKTRVTWTTEDMGPCNKILYAPRRWIRLAQIQHHVERTIILVDTDSVINGDIPKALPPSFDVVLYDRSEDPWLHQTINGAFLAVTPQGRDFTDFLAAYILYFEDLGIPKWFDDQFNMVCARAWFEANVPDFTIKYCTKNMMDWTGTRRPESLIWHAKGELKEQRK